jgi:hypothetical protein
LLKRPTTDSGEPKYCREASPLTVVKQNIYEKPYRRRRRSKILPENSTIGNGD